MILTVGVGIRTCLFVGYMAGISHSRANTTGACYEFFVIPPLTTLKTTREESSMSNFHTIPFREAHVEIWSGAHI